MTLKGQVVTPIRLKPNISKTAGDATAVRSAILATAWLLVRSRFYEYRHRTTDEQTDLLLKICNEAHKWKAP